MVQTWVTVLPPALLAAAVVALVRPSYLREAEPGWALRQRVGLLLVTAPLMVLILVGLNSLPRLFEGALAFPAPSKVLAGKALIHFLLYLAIPLVGLVMVMGPKDLKARVMRHMVGDQPALQGLTRGLTRATVIGGCLVAGVTLGWSALSGQAGLLSAEGPRLFFSNTTPGIALALAGVAAVAEEVLFRGVLLGQLRRVIGKHPAVVLQALLFGLIHAGYGSVMHVAAAASFGLLVGYLATRDGLMPAMIVHFLVNVAVLAAWSGHGALLVTAGLLLASMAWLAWYLQTAEAPATDEPVPA